jgi:hypothetical protein
MGAGGEGFRREGGLSTASRDSFSACRDAWPPTPDGPIDVVLHPYCPKETSLSIPPPE